MDETQWGASRTGPLVIIDQRRATPRKGVAD
jgi:hypothetical protein